MKLTITLEQQRAELATIPLDGNHVPNSRLAFSREMGGTGLSGLVANFRKVGIEPTDAAKYDVLNAVELPEPAKRAPGRYLDMDPQAYAEQIAEAAAYQAAKDAARKHVSNVRKVLGREFENSVSGEAEQSLDLLRDSFTFAIEGIRRVVDFGLGPQHDAQSAIDCGPAAGEAWRAMTARTGHAKVLDGIASIRIAMCHALGIVPVNIEHSGSSAPIRYGPCFGVGDEFDRYIGFQRWLATAATGTARLVPIAELTPIIAERKRAAAALVRSPTDDMPAEPVSLSSTPWQF